jgi:hypothetical protein
MPRKASPRKLTNFQVLLQDIHNCLGEDYVFYEECIVAITRADARQEDASAWYEQLQQVVAGVAKVAYSHAGVLLFLARSSEGASSSTLHSPWQLTFSLAAQRGKMPPPPLPHRITAAPPPATMSDMLFEDPAFKSEVEAFFGVKASAHAITTPRYPHSSFTLSASLSDYSHFMPHYRSADDDLQVFRERAATTTTTEDNKTPNETVRAKREREWQELLREVSNREAAESA